MTVKEQIYKEIDSMPNYLLLDVFRIIKLLSKEKTQKSMRLKDLEGLWAGLVIDEDLINEAKN